MIVLGSRQVSRVTFILEVFEAGSSDMCLERIFYFDYLDEVSRSEIILQEPEEFFERIDNFDLRMQDEGYEIESEDDISTPSEHRTWMLRKFYKLKQPREQDIN